MQSVHTIFQDLVQQIKQEQKVETISDQFSQIQTNSNRVNFVYELLKGRKLLPEIVTDSKCDKRAIRLREEGNLRFKNKELKEALDLYTESLAHAEPDLENFCKALANRSAVLFELKLYNESLKDINRALENQYPKDLQPKLLKRKERALELRPKNKIPYFKPVPYIPETSKSKSIDCASNSIEIKYSELEGRHIVATRNIEVGEILAVEKPFCSFLVSEYFSHCHECLQLCYNLLPCTGCTQVLYCSEECTKKAYVYHKFECKTLKTLRLLQLNKMKLLPLKTALIVKENYREILKDCNLLESQKYKSDRYNEIHNLVGNTSSRSVADLFERSATAAVIFHLLKTSGDFFHSEDEEKVFRDLVLLHFQTGPCNFHEISELKRTEDGYFDSEEIGAGAFGFLSLFNHSCNPNIVRHCHGSEVVVRAIRSIRKGEQCYENYGYHFAVMPKVERRNNLKKQYFFDCICEVCENNWPLLDDLPSISIDTNVTNEDTTNLRKGDEETAEKVLQKLLPKMKELEKIQPNRLFFEMQEVLKRCYAIFGNVRRY